MATQQAMELRTRVRELDAQRRAIEAELELLVSQLGPAGMTEPLVDGASASGPAP